MQHEFLICLQNYTKQGSVSLASSQHVYSAHIHKTQLFGISIWVLGAPVGHVYISTNDSEEPALKY